MITRKYNDYVKIKLLTAMFFQVFHCALAFAFHKEYNPKLLVLVGLP